MSQVGGQGRGARPVPPPRHRHAPEGPRPPSSALALRPPAALQVYDPRRHRAPLQPPPRRQLQAVPAPIPAPAAPAAPRTLVLHRPDAHRGFGFTLRHLVVYPPENLNELYDDGRHLAVGVLGAPMDTIFVRSVRERGAAAAAGLRAGDRVVAVNGEPVLCGGRAPYARVVQLAQREPHRLTLTVVPRDADVLQRYFSEAAYNPETNQRPQRALPMAAARREHAAEYASVAGDSRRDSAASPDDALILSRIRKSLEQKEAFLRRPSQPTGWLDPPPALVQREFYARPQKLQKPMWPPNSNGHSIKPIEHRRPERASVATDDYYHQNAEQREEYASVGSSLSQIQEMPVSSLNSRSSLNGSFSGAEDRAPSSISSQESKYPVPTELAIVTSRRRQLAAARDTARDRTALYRSELARLITTRPEPTVALRRREFETRGAARRDARSLDAHNSQDEADMDSLLAASLSGNCLTITGSKHLHCPPPSGFTAVADTEKVQLRARSNSIGSETMPTRRHQTSDGSHMKRRLGLDHEQLEALNRTSLQEPKGESSNSSNCDINQVPNDYKEVSNKHPTSDGFAWNGRVPRIAENDRVSDEDFGRSYASSRAAPEKSFPKEPAKKLERPNQLSLAPPAEVFGVCSPSTTPTTPTSPAGFVDDTVTRRQKNAAQMGAEEERAMRRVSYLKATWGDRLHLDSDPELSDGEPHSTRSVEKKSEGATLTEEVDHGDPTDNGIIIQGNVQVKMVLINGKRASDRSWKQVWAVLHGPKLYLYRHHSNQSPSAAAGGASGSRESLDVRYSLADVAGDYTKRKHVLRVTCAAGAELLLQAEGAGDAARWLRALRCQAATPDRRGEDDQAPAGADDAEWSGAPRGLSPLPPQRTKKMSRNRSPTGPPTPTLPSSPKTKTWKGRMARQLRRMHGGGGAAPAGLLGAPLERCPTEADLPGVPLAVRACAAAVEARGLRTVGLYRVPGNAAGVAALAAALDRGEPPPAADPRWADVHVVSSLLKAFFRKLPDSLLTAELYPALMVADRARGGERARALRRLVRALPAAHYETLAFVVRHLRRVASEAHVNKMEARNLAIVFGPTLVRGADDDMLTMVNDMSSQCRIIESLINHYEWYFDEEERGSPVSDPPGDEELASTTSNQALLIDNVKKIEGKEVTTRDIVSSIISAANRKIQRKPRSKPSTSSSGNLDNVSKKSSDSQDKSPVDSQQLELASSDETLGSGSGETLPGASRENCSSPTFQPYHYTQSLADYDGLPIKTYSGLNQTTQERIKKFEMETKAMLQRDKRRDVASLVDWSASAIANLKNGQMNRDATSKSEAANIVSKEIAASSASGKRINTSSLSSFSIEGTGDLVSSLTSTFDQKLRTLNSSALLNDGSIPYVDECQEDAHAGEPTAGDSVKGKSIPENKHYRKESAAKVGDSEQRNKSKFPPVHLNKVEVKCQNKDEDESNYDSEKENDTKSSPLLSMTTEYKSNKSNLPEKKYENTLDYEKDIDTASRSENEKGNLDNDVCVEKKILNTQNAPKNMLRNSNAETVKRNSAVLENCSDIKLGVSKSGSPNSFGIKLKRSESLNRETGRDATTIPNNKVLRSESLNYKVDKVSPTRAKLQRSESLNKPEYSYSAGGDLVKRADSLNKSDAKLKFSDCLSKSEKTESNILKQRELSNGLYRSTKLKRKNGMPERSIKRRHTVGGTKDFDKDGWVDRHSRTSSPDLTHMSLIAPLTPLILPLESHV